MAQHHPWTEGRLPLSQIRQLPRNPKEHDRDGIKRSICRFGFADPFVVNLSTGHLVGGHGRDDALADLRTDPPINDNGHWPQGYYQHSSGVWLPKGITLTDDGEWAGPVWWVDVLEPEEEPLALALNRWTEMGGWNLQRLGQVLNDIAARGADALDGIGYEPDDVALLVQSIDFPPLPEVTPDGALESGAGEHIHIRVANRELARDAIAAFRALIDDHPEWEATFIG